ncbi:unnamed protein product [Ilex paraguariensis]|uniref:Protein BIG GRAIN 1-like B n=1 Tax=Ilex paraguariensis TaxID=185542 RepID=A0ABC8TXU3_9AQUA
MYSLEKSLREDKLRKNPKNPSFSSSLLDEIYRSIDDGDQKPGDLKNYGERTLKKQIIKSGATVRARTSDREDEGMASLRRACLIEKWMEKRVSDKVTARRRESSLPEMDRKALHDINDPLFFSSTSSSSDSSFGGFSSSETESFGFAKSNSSCFTAPWPKPVRTSVSDRTRKLENSISHEQSDFYFFDDYQNHQTSKEEVSLMMNSKSRALKIYANLKKVKQPISPGGRITNFLNSLFTNGNAKKAKNSGPVGGYVDACFERKTKFTQESTCSSASSFSRSCLSKTSPNSREKRKNGNKRTVRFFPVGVIVDEDCRPCGHKCIYDEDSEKLRSPLPKPAEFQKTLYTQRNLKVVEGKRDNLKGYQNHKKNNFMVLRNEANNYVDDDEDDYDAASDSSSDLFELDHLAFFGNKRFCEDLPVYETTHLARNRAIANGLIC